MKKIVLRRKNGKSKAELEFQELYGIRVGELLEICAKYQGEYLGADHGPGSWATTYSDEFINASVELYKIYSQSGMGLPLFLMSDAFMNAGILSCRRSSMDIDRVEYLFKTHVKPKL